ncbi:MAG TPA: amino acid adenylation domain-containing protein [Pyrinomonadaceae bacterium]|nr:amino acid adenylation domain-containing protein [Pyrinomonadaceae bacterium]
MTDNLDPDRLELLDYLLEEEGIETGSESQKIIRRVPRDTLPLSFAQQRLWFLDQLAPGGAAYNLSGRLHLEGRLDISALEASLNEIVRRHEALRTIFATRDGEPVQIILSERRLPLPLIEREEEARPFDLSTGPLVRAHLLRLSTKEHVLLLSMHHIVSDGWSIGVLIREVATLYEAYAARKESPLRELSLQYGDYAVWQRHWLQGDVLDQQLSYWRKQLDGVSVLELPLDKPRSATSSLHSATLTCNLAKKVSEELQALSRGEGVTLFMCLLAAFQLLLWRYSGQDDIAIGTPVANRTRAETEDLIGFFVNTLVLRTDVSGNPTFRELLQRVRETALGAYAHQDMPFEKLVEELAPERNLSVTPLFQVMFALENAPLPEVEAHGLKMRPEALVGDTAKFDLALGIVETPDGLIADWQYRSELFEAATIERVASHFQTLLEGIVAEPDARIADLPLLTAGERQQLLVEWNETPQPLNSTPLVHELFAQHAIQRANAPALLFEEQTLTFEQINRRTNQLAHHLLNHGAHRETTIGVMLERGPASLVALLAVFKAGGCYLPLDPLYPPERLAFMCGDARASLIITEESVRARLPESAARVVCLDADARQLAQQRTEDPTVQVLPQQLAYVIYTSGSTGRPKGVAIEHRQLRHTLSTAQEVLQLTPEDCLACIASFSFDISLLELLAAPLAGGRCLLVSTRKALEADVMKRVLAEATVLHAVPGVMRRLVEFAREYEGRALKQLLVGGEAVAPELIAEIEEVFPRATVRVLYGPTEATIICAGYEVDRSARVRGQMVGKPLRNVVLRLLDEWGRLVPVGVEGEICVGGEGVARGYHYAADLTAARFVADEYSACAGARIYRTGDRGRYLANGNIVFTGRIDEQVKVRGFRIEPGEIENALAEHEGVKEAIVVARDETDGEKRVVAYIIAGQEDRPGINELRSHLKSRLPDYMIPSAFVYLEALPLTSHGKIDRRALPAPDAERPALAEMFLAPRSGVEEMLASIWSDVLGVTAGVNDNFFELGGHSLLATQVMSRVREAFGIEIALRRLFEQPTIGELAETIEAGLAEGVVMPPRVARAEREGNVMPLSFAQQRLWFIDQLEPGNPVYNTSRSVRLRGTLDVAALKRALTELIRRHEALRTTFRDLHGEPVQVIGNAEPFIVTVEELTGLPEATLICEEVQRPFNLSTGPLIRARLLRLSPEEHILLVSMHHIVSDGWSMGVLVREVAALYEAYAVGAESALKELSLQYGDYAVWQREWLRGEVLERQLDYWREQLAGVPPVLELPADRPRPHVQTFRGASLPFKLSRELAEELRALSRREGVTLYMTLLAVLQTLLWRYTGEDDIAVGTPIANRRHGELEGLIGFFANTLVLRTDVSGNPTFASLVQRVKEMALGAYTHQDVPFEMLVEVLQPERSMSYTPLFQVLFALQNAPQEKLELSGLTLDLLNIDSGTAHFDLALLLEETEEGLEGVCEYSTDLFDEATIFRLLGHFETLLEGVINNPDQHLSHLPLLSPAERHQLLDEWNTPAEQFSSDLCVHELFAQQAEHRPDEVAVLFEETQLNYRELNERANQLAHRLRTLGVGPEQVVGVMLERSPETIVAILAVLKAGGAYMPLDPSYPPDRLQFMIEDAKPAAILTAEGLSATDYTDQGHGSDPRLIRRLDPRHPCYVIYTSGSTGRPKAVVMPHRGAVNLIKYQMQSTGPERRLRTLQFASLSFDVSFQEIFPTLCAGGSLVLLREDARRDAGELLRVITEQRVERLFLPFVALQHLAEEADRQKSVPTSLRQVITAGEQLKITPHVARFFQRLDGCTLDNHYGPTEAHLVTRWRLEGDAGSWPKLPPIGKPITNAQVYVLDDALEPVPAGVRGELYIGGAQLARGYLNRPDQTAERFIPHPFSHDEGARLYRTGDLVRYLANGVLEYFGRRDLQVKVRGFRVEVGEIEAVLKQHRLVEQAVVTVRDDDAGRKRLVAYIVAAQTSAPPPREELRRHLKDKLPEYMIPSLFLLLDTLPLTGSGKVDRRALPAPDAERAALAEVFLAPRSGVEEMLAAIWSDVLGVRAGVNDNFFELGGHSLLATQVMSRVREAFGIEIALRSLFEQPTIGELAETIDAGLRARVGIPPRMERMERAQREGNVMPLSFAQQRLWFLDKFEKDSSFYNLPATVRICGATLNVSALEKGLREVTQRHEVLRTTFTTIEGQPVQVIAPESHFTLPVSDLGGLPPAPREAEAQRLAREEAQRPFDLSTGPLVRARLLRLAPEDHVLLLSMHHIVSDGWSMGVLVREVAALYEAYAVGAESTLKELSLQYGDYALWQRDWLQGAVLDQQLAYWRKQLAGVPPVLELPTDYPRPAVRTFNGASLSLRLPRWLTEELKTLSRGEGVTLFMTLMATFQLLLWRYTGQEDIAVGTPVANRTRAETEDLIGFFVNALVLRTDVSGNPTFRELLQRVRETALGAYAHQDIPFEKLVEELAPERNLSVTPLFQVVFAMQNTPSPEIRLKDLQLSLVEAERETSKFDIVLAMWETGEDLEGSLEYNTDLFEAATMQRLLHHFQRLLEGIVKDPDASIADLPLLAASERQQLLIEWNDTRKTFRQELCIHQLFESQAAKNPNATAVVFEDEQFSYDELNRRANRLAHKLIELGIGPEMRAGVLMERSLVMVLAVMSVLKAGGTYVPLDPSWPLERLRWIASSLGIRCLLTQHAKLRAIHELQWKLPHLTDVICLDVETQRPRAETLDQGVVRSIWDHVAEQSVDEVTAGGFISSYTGEPFAESEVREYVDRVAELAQPFLGADRRVLEIGCGSGLVMFELAPRVGRYVGLDPSAATQKQNLSRVAEKGSDKIKLVTGFADQIDTMFEPESFDLIVMASTAQFFPGPNYFAAVLEKSLKLLAPGGTILLSDIMDARRKQEFGESLQDFQRLTPQARTKTKLDGELYFDEAYFFDLEATLPDVCDVRIRHREQGFRNELGYRFDVILKKDDGRECARDHRTMQPRKRIWTNWHLQTLPESNPPTKVDSANVAYIIHTSGSTGEPKGVMVQHRPIINLIEWVNTTFKVGAGDRLLFVTSLNFDLSVYDIFGALAAGATIHVASRADLREPQRLAGILQEQPITFWDSAPVALQQLTPYFSNGPGHLRLVFLSGDWIPLRLPEEVRAAFPKTQVISLGGATEASVWSNVFPVTTIEPHWASIPYGKPLQNARYHILDSRLSPVPIGVPGDLYIGGECLALGYTDASLTAEQFIPDPFSVEGGARLYMTGDRARYHADGNIEFLGRRDQQVKIRGYRIELGEIETALAANRAVREAVVTVREDLPGEKRLVGYIVPAQQSAPTTSELHSFLKEKLPGYMLPSAFVMLEALPLTPNGKLNRRALPAPDASRPALAASYLAPATELERRIAEIWQDILGVDRIGMRDNFFELGGHSLLLVQMHARLNETLRQEVSIIELFKYPTIASLAAHLTEDQEKISVDTSNVRRAAERREALKDRARSR